MTDFTLEAKYPMWDLPHYLIGHCQLNKNLGHYYQEGAYAQSIHFMLDCSYDFTYLVPIYLHSNWEAMMSFQVSVLSLTLCTLYVKMMVIPLEQPD